MTADEMPISFFDTNVLVYALAADDIRRSVVAQTLLRDLMTAQVFQTSTQVLQELFVTLTRKVRTPMTAEQALRYLDQIDPLARRIGAVNTVWRKAGKWSALPTSRMASTI